MPYPLGQDVYHGRAHMAGEPGWKKRLDHKAEEAAPKLLPRTPELFVLPAHALRLPRREVRSRS